MFTEDGGYDVVERVERVPLERAGATTSTSSTRTTSSRTGSSPTTRSTASAAPTSATSWTSRTTIPTPTSSSSSRTTARRRRSSTPPTRSSPTTAAQKRKSLWTDLGEGDPISIRELDDEHAEARFVVGEIERLLDEGVVRAEIAVFYRTNAQSRVLEDTLVRREVAYQVIGGTKFYERAEIKDALAYLIVLANPQDANAFTRIANAPRRGIGATSLSRVLAHAARSASRSGTPPPTRARCPGSGPPRRRPSAGSWRRWSALRERVGQQVARRRAARGVLHETGYLEALEAERTIEAQGRIENLEELVEVAREYDATPTGRGRGRRAGGVPAADRAASRTPDTRSDDEGLVTLMTLHNAKGLEYPVVFMIGCEEGVFPHSARSTRAALEEERRLCYVGITRAMRDLYLTYARAPRRSSARRTTGCASRFLDEIPRELTDGEEQPGLRRRAPRAAGDVSSGARRAAETAAEPHFRHRRRRRACRVRRGRRDRRSSRAGSWSCGSPATARSAS